MSYAGDGESQLPGAKDEGDEKLDSVEEIGTMPSASQITSEMMQNPQVLAALQQRLDSIVGTPSGYIENLPKTIKRRIHALKNLQVETTKLEAKFYEEVHELERKYSDMYKPLFDKRKTIIVGSYEPNDEECEWHSESEEEEEDGEKKEENNKEVNDITEKLNESAKIEDSATVGEDAKGIPEFWLTILKNVPLFQEMVQEHDEPILAKLQDIKVTFSPPGEQMSFTLEFMFDSNPYFTNKVLTKHYKLQSQPDDKDPFSFEGPEIIACLGCKIDWVKGKNVTVKTIKKKQKHKGRGTVRTVTKQVPNDSFFNFFTPPDVPEGDEEMDSDTEALLTSDFEIGHMFRERIIPRAVLYFTGEAGDDDFDDEEDEDDEDEDGDRLNDMGDSDDSEGANDSDYDPEKDPKAKDTPQECKQQ